MRAAFKELIQPICDSKDGIHLRVADRQYSTHVFFVPRVPFFICDEMDLPLVTGMKSCNSKTPCNVCTLSFKDATSITAIGDKRCPEAMKQVKVPHIQVLLYKLMQLFADHVDKRRESAL